MAGKNIKGITIEIDGKTTGLDKALAGARAKSKAFSNDVKGLNHLMKLDPKNMDLFRMKQAALQKSIGELKNRLKTLSDASKELDRRFKEGTISEEEYRRAKDEIIRETVIAKNALKNEEAELKAVNFQMSKMGRLSAKLQMVGDKLTNLGRTLMPLSIAAAGATAAMGGLAVKAGQYADDINTLSKQTGIATRDLQLFSGASDLVDVSVEDLARGHAKLTKTMFAAKEGTKASKEAFNQLGISVVDSNGKLRDNKVVFSEVVTALSKMENGTERDALAFQLFGKSAQQLNPLILGGAEQLAEFTKEAEKMGIVLDQKTLDKANKFNDVIDKTKALLKLTGMAIGSQFAEILLPTFEKVSRKVLQVAKAFKELSPRTKKLILALTGIAAGAAPTLLVLGKLATGVSKLIRPFMNVVKYIKPFILSLGINPIMLAVGAIVALGATALALGDKFGLTEKKVSGFITKIIDKILSVIDKIVANLPKFMAAGTKLIIGLINGIIKMLPKIVQSATKLIVGLVQGLTRALPKLIAAAPKIIKALASGLIKSIPILIKAAPKIIKALSSAVISASAALVKAGLQLIKALWKGFASWISGFYGKVKSFAKSIPQKIKSGIGSLASIGANIIQGIWKGIQSKVSWLWGKLSSVGSGIKKKFKNMLEIFSPSRWMDREIGQNIMKGIAVGIKKGVTFTDKAITNSANKILDTYKKKLTDIKKNISDYAKNLMGSVNLFEAVEIEKEDGEKEEVLNSDVVIANMAKRKDEIEKFYQNIKTLKEQNLPKGLLYELLEQGVEGNGNLELIKSMTPEQQKEFVQNYLGSKKFSKVASQEIGKLLYGQNMVAASREAEKSMNKLGGSLSESFKKAMKKNAKLKQGEAQAIARNLTRGLREELQKELLAIKNSMNLGIEPPKQKKTKKTKGKTSQNGIVQNIYVTNPTNTPSTVGKAIKKATRQVLLARA